MFNNRRSEIDIIGEILSLSQNSIRKTEILYQANLCYLQLKNYLSFLIEKEILTENVIKNNGTSFSLYKTTPKGDELLIKINKTLSYFK